LIALIAALHGIIDASGHMISKDQFFHAGERRPHREKLGYDVDAVAILLDHPDDATKLPRDATKPGDGGSPVVRFHRAISGVLVIALARRWRTGPRTAFNFFYHAILETGVDPDQGSPWGYRVSISRA
jgi:hypothetical protein